MVKNVTMDNQSSYKKVKHLEKDEKKHSPALTTAHKDLRLSWTKDHVTCTLKKIGTLLNP